MKGLVERSQGNTRGQCTVEGVTYVLLTNDMICRQDGKNGLVPVSDGEIPNEARSLLLCNRQPRLQKTADEDEPANHREWALF